MGNGNSIAQGDTRRSYSLEQCGNGWIVNASTETFGISHGDGRVGLVGGNSFKNERFVSESIGGALDIINNHNAQFAQEGEVKQVA